MGKKNFTEEDIAKARLQAEVWNRRILTLNEAVIFPLEAAFDNAIKTALNAHEYEAYAHLTQLKEKLLVHNPQRFSQTLVAMIDP